MASETVPPTRTELKSQSHVMIKEFSQEPAARKDDPELIECLERAVVSASDPTSTAASSAPSETTGKGNHDDDLDCELRLKYRTLYEADTDEVSAVPEDPELDVQHKKLSASCSEFWDFLHETQRQEEEKQARKRGDETSKSERKRDRFLGRHSKRKDSTVEEKSAPPDSSAPPKKQPEGQAEVPKDMVTTMADIKSAINSVYSSQTAHEEKPRKLRKYWQRFCQNMDCHSTMFSMIPSENQYTSVFCGAVQLLVKATVNYIKISEELAKSLDLITHHVSLTTDHLTLWSHRQDITLLVSSLYAYIFRFLRSCLSWLLSSSLRRSMHSFNEGFADTFTEHIDKIAAVAKLVRDKAQVKSQAEVREVRAGVKDLSVGNEELKAGNAAVRADLAKMHGMLREEAEERKREKEAKREKRHTGQMGDKDWDRFSEALGQKLLGMLESNFEAWYQKGAAPKGKKKSKGQAASSGKTIYNRHSLQLSSAHLADHITDMTRHLSLASSTHTDIAVIEALQTWSSTPDPCRLWIRGTGNNGDEEEYPTSTSRVAATVLARALRFDIPVLGFFCESPLEDDEDSDRTMGEEYWDEVAQGMLVNLVYTLIRQIIALLPRTIESRKKLSRSVFRELDGTLESWDAAIKVLKLMLRVAPKTCLVVLDGLDRLGGEWAEYVEDVMGAVGKYTADDSARQWKLLVTTEGTCEALEDVLDEDDVVETTPRWRRRGQLDIEEELDGGGYV